MKTLLVALNAKFVQSNLAVYALRTACQREGIHCKIYESNVNELIESHLTSIVGYNPDVVGFSCYIWNIDVIRRLITDLKKLLPKTVIVLGGTEVSETPEEALRKYQADYVINGPGEAVWPELLLSFKSGSLPDNKVLSKPISLAETFFPYQKEDELKNHLVYYESSRGCANRCAYCLSSVDRAVEFRPLDLVYTDLKQLWHKGVRQVKFVDRTFNLDKKRTLALWEHLYDNYPDGNFHFEISADRISDEEIDFLKKVPPGLFQMEIGVQSTNPPTLKAINRKTDIEKLLKRISQLSKETKVLIYADLIAGLPFESYQRFLQSFKDVLKTRPDRLHLGFLKLLPGTLLRENAEQFGIVYSDYPPYEVLKTKDISYMELAELKGLDFAIDRFYNSDLFTETLDEVLDVGDFFLELTKRLKENGLLFSRSKLEAYFRFLAKEFPELSDYVLLDFLKQGLSRSLPSWYQGTLKLEEGVTRPKDISKKRPILFISLPVKLQEKYDAKVIALVMGMPHIDRRCQEIRKIN
ncbi:MAG: radical SAM protein [Firmicutes bacterium]|nr:radical SAM protein [Bacillota bacterium]MDD4263327.1 radical SAM protein [Bacillota bacterium]